MNDPLFLIGTVLLVLAAIPANGICWTYHNVPWRKSRLGRIMFMKAATVATVLNFSIVGSILIYLDMGRPVWWEVIRLLTFAAVTYALWAQWGAYRDILHDAERREKEQGEPGFNDDTAGHTFS